MKDEVFKAALERIPIPKSSENVRSRARHRAIIACNNRVDYKAAEVISHGRAWYFVSGVLMAMLIGLLPFRHFTEKSQSENLAADQQILHQVEKLFPNQVDAVVEEQGKVNLLIAQSPLLGCKQPVLVVFKKGNEAIRILSYSGHRICIKLGGAENCFDILSTPTGGILLEGDKSVYVASDHPKVEGYSVGAQNLEASL